ncbi:hypothetical protein BJY52DRAFT_1402283 [Lactarius psammicola]|nr:hypothetical protein BJY52DRAFT_1402283 [Lactarius psammicola]
MSGAAHPTHELHRGDIPYEAPFVRSASPNDSLTTAYGADETSLSDTELSEDSFSTKVLGELRIHEKREEEERAETRPLIMPRPRRGAAFNGDEKAMFDQVMRSLRWHVEQLEDQDSIETSVQRRTKAIPETESSASEIDVIMENMMEPQGRPPWSSNGMNVDESLPRRSAGHGQ